MTRNSLDAIQVARRSLVLAAVVCRGSIEAGVGDPEMDALHYRLREWLTELNLWKEAEPSEEIILHTPLGELAPQKVIEATWYAEGLAILAWAIKQLEYPRHDQKVDPYAVSDAVWLLRENAVEVVSAAGLQDMTQLEAARELLYALHVRLRHYLRNGERKDFAHSIERTWLDALNLDVTHLIIDNDLAIDDKPLSEVEYDRVQECEWLIRERHRAIIWLVERTPSYSQTPVDT